MWWKKIWGLTGKNKTPVVLSDPETNLAMNNKDAANTINNFLASLTSDFREVESKWSGYCHLDTLPVVTLESVEKKLSSIKSNKAPGPSVPCLKIIKIFSKSFAVPLADIFNTSFLDKTFPTLWKLLYVIAIPKVAPCTDLDDLRPISLTSTLSKIQESYVVDWMHEDIKDGFAVNNMAGYLVLRQYLPWFIYYTNGTK